ncbi:MAG: hypothetical protein JJT81_09255 [Rubellimicrobium sp.]|nr:hypothetical protein [Rubellimicrobium sp.]
MKTPRQDIPKASDRQARLKEALKANIARRKAQAHAREAGQDDTSHSDGTGPGSEEGAS